MYLGLKLFSKASPHSKPPRGTPGGHRLEPEVPCSANCPRWNADLVLESLAKHFLFPHLFSSLPQPGCSPSSSSLLSFLPSPLLSPPPPRGFMAAPSSLPPRFCLEICPPVWAGPFPGPPAAQLPPASATGTPPQPNREGRSSQGALPSPQSFCSHSFSHWQPPTPSGPGSFHVQCEFLSPPLQRLLCCTEGTSIFCKRTQV